jgi:pyruvate/2-oxoglutarate dehydrogenase complex dihydrolipoamide acyltransferase (E2) component
MAKIEVSENLWTSTMLPEGFVERWLVADGATVGSGEAVAEVRVEDALLQVLAPVAGRLHIHKPANGVIEPGAVLGEVTS